MKCQRAVVKGAGLAVVGLIVVAGFGSAVLYLWNWLMPGIFGLRAITFGESLGLMGLSWILFGGLRGFGRPPRRHVLPPEDRERVRRALDTGPAG